MDRNRCARDRKEKPDILPPSKMDAYVSKVRPNALKARLRILKARLNVLKASSVCSARPILITLSLLVFFRYCLPSMGMITYSETLKSLLLDCLLNLYCQTNSLQVASYY